MMKIKEKKLKETVLLDSISSRIDSLSYRIDYSLEQVEKWNNKSKELENTLKIKINK